MNSRYLYSWVLLGWLSINATGQTMTGREPSQTRSDTARLLDPVMITGSGASGYRQVQTDVGLFGSLPVKDIPLSLHITSGELFVNRHAHTISDALQTDPTVAVLMSSNTYSSMSRVMVRGFTAADQSELRDGLTDRSFTVPHLENVERIEVINGLSALLYGFSALGGSVNYVNKKPVAKPLAMLSLGSYGGGIRYIQADVGGTMTEDGRLTSRFNVYREDGNTYISGSSQRRTLLTGAFDYKVNEHTHIKADIAGQHAWMEGLQTYFALPANAGSIPEATDATRQYGQPWTYNESTKTQVGVGLETRLAEMLKLRAAFRYNDLWRKYSYVAAKLLDASTYNEVYFDTPRQYETTHSAYAYLDADVQTGALRHTVTLGYSLNEYLFKRGVDIQVPLGTSNLAAPASFDIPDSATVLTTYGRQILQSIQFSDRVMISGSWQLIMGLNYASLHNEGGGIYTGWTTSDFTQHRLSPGISMVYKPAVGLTVYGSYMQGLAAGGTAPATAANANVQLKPSVNDQYEVGAKSTLGMLDLTTALFRINKVNEYIDPADQIYKQDGRQVHQGLEVTATGKLTERLTLVGGFTLMRARMEKAANNTSIENKIPINVPQQQARIYLEYRVPGLSGLTASSGANYFGKRPVNSTNTIFLPGVTTVDAGLRYQRPMLHHEVCLNLTAGNLLNKSYWANYRDGDGLQLATPRIVSFSIRVNLETAAEQGRSKSIVQ